MKTLKLDQLSLDNLSHEELAETNGGSGNWLISFVTNPVAATAAAVVYVGAKCIDDWGCFKDGLLGNDFKHH